MSLPQKHQVGQACLTLISFKEPSPSFSSQCDTHQFVRRTFPFSADMQGHRLALQLMYWGYPLVPLVAMQRPACNWSGEKKLYINLNNFKPKTSILGSRKKCDEVLVMEWRIWSPGAKLCSSWLQFILNVFFKSISFFCVLLHFSKRGSHEFKKEVSL